MKYYATKLSENISETPEGYLLCLDVLIARTGDMDYGATETPLQAKNGKVVVSRSEEEVFRPETMASFEGKPLTIRHPEEFVDPSNWKELAVGIMQNVRRGAGDDSQNLVCDLLITDDMAISLVKNGLRGLSCGYEAEYTQTGEGKGIQTNIIGNHLALVEEGRAGLTYAINDHKGETKMNKTFADKMKAIFSKTIDEAVKEESAAEKKDAPAKDEEMMPGYDELVKVCNELKETLAGMAPKAKDEDPEKKVEEKKEPGKDEEVAPGIEDRLKTLELAVQKLMESMSTEESNSLDEDDMDTEDEEENEGTEQAAVMTGDVLSRAEILSPGIQKTKDIKAQALKAAYATKDGKRIIEALNAGKAPAYDSADKVELLFTAASEVLKAERVGQLANTKKATTDFSSVIFDQDRYMTPEKMNEKNAQLYNVKK